MEVSAIEVLSKKWTGAVLQQINYGEGGGGGGFTMVGGGGVFELY